MRFRFFLLILVFLVAIPSGAKGGEKMKAGADFSFPQEAAGWKWDGKDRVYNSRTVFDYIDGAAELFLAYGFKDLTVRRFEKLGQPPIIAEVYEMGSPEDAYGVFSFERQG